MDENTQAPTPTKLPNPMMIAGFAVIIAILAIGVLINRNRTTTTPTGQENQVVEETPNTTENNDIRVIAVEAGSFYYKPNFIRVKKDERVKIELTAKDAMHDFNVDELGIKIPVTTAGNINTVEFAANEVGEFEYYCSVGQHRQNGQVGTLIVEE